LYQEFKAGDAGPNQTPQNQTPQPPPENPPPNGTLSFRLLNLMIQQEKESDRGKEEMSHRRKGGRITRHAWIREATRYHAFLNTGFRKRGGQGQSTPLILNYEQGLKGGIRYRRRELPLQIFLLFQEKYEGGGRGGARLATNDEPQSKHGGVWDLRGYHFTTAREKSIEGDQTSFNLGGGTLWSRVAHEHDGASFHVREMKKRKIDLSMN